MLLAFIWWPVGFVLATTYFIFISRRYAGKVSVRRDNQGFTSGATVPKWAISVLRFQLITICSGSFTAIHNGSEGASMIPTLRYSARRCSRSVAWPRVATQSQRPCDLHIVNICIYKDWMNALTPPAANAFTQFRRRQKLLGCYLPQHMSFAARHLEIKG